MPNRIGVFLVDVARLIEIIEPEARALGFELVRVKLTGSGDERVLQVMAEDPGTGQLVVEQCAELSRAISSAIDAVEEGGEELVEGAYNLEVSSPGIDRPLTRPKDYADWAGHEVKVALLEKIAGQRTITGELVGLSTDDCVIVGTRAGEVDIPLANIHAAQLVLTDKLIAATRPIDTTGAEEFEDDSDTTDKEKVDD